MSRILGSVIFLLSATIASRGFGVVRSFWLARILDPSEYGMWIFVLLISAYAPIVGLGVGEALLKRVPFYLGKNDKSALRDVEGGVLSFSILLAILFVPIIILLPKILSKGSLSGFVLPVQLMTAAFCVSFFSGYFTLRLQAYQRFPSLSAITAARAIALLVFQISLSYLFGLIGAVLGFLLCEVFVCFYAGFLNTKLPNPLSVRFSLPLYRSLIATGLPITLVWWTYGLQTSVDRIVSMAMLGEAQTGFYGLGMSIATAFLLIPESINMVLYPSVNEEYGRTRSRDALIPLVVEPARIMSLLLPLFAFISMLLLPLIFRFIVPKYIPGVRATEILILAALFMGMTKAGTNLLISIDRQGRLLLYILGTVLLNLTGNIALVKIGFGINGIAVSTTIATVFFALAIWFSVFSAFRFPFREAIGMIARLFWPALLFMMFIAGDSFAIQRARLGLLLSSIVTFGSFLLYWLLLMSSVKYRALVIDSLRAGIGAFKSRKAVIKPPARFD